MLALQDRLINKNDLGRSGQAMVEMLFGVFFSLMIMFVALNYFQLLRASIMREEALRNVAFAKIANVGTLTTPREHSAGAPVFLASGSIAFQRQKNEMVSSQIPCFILQAENPLSILSPGNRLVPGGLLGSKQALGDPKIITFAIVNRRPSSRCSNGRMWTAGLP